MDAVLVSHGDQDASVSGAHDDHGDEEEIRPGKESEMRCLALAAVSWSRQARPRSALSSNTSLSSHLSLGAGKLFSEHNQPFE